MKQIRTSERTTGLWLNISYVNIDMFLLLTLSPHSGEELKKKL